MAPGAVKTTPRFDWCYNNAGDYAATSIDASTKYMASGFTLSTDGAQINLYSGGEPITHGGGGGPGAAEGTMMGNHTGVRRHIMRRDGFVGVEAGYGGAHLPASQWPQVLTVPLRVPNASACASGDVELRANLLSGAGGGAYFQLELAAEAFPNYTLSNSVLLRGNWIDGPVSWGDDDPDIGARVVTRFSNNDVQVRVAMRDAELFSLSFRCVQRSK